MAVDTRQSGMYRFAIAASVVLAVTAVVLLLAHYFFGILRPKGLRLMVASLVLAPLLVYGYWADDREREAATQPRRGDDFEEADREDQP